VLAAPPCVSCVHGIPSMGVLNFQRLARQSMGKALVGSDPRIIEVIHDGIFISADPTAIVIISLRLFRDRMPFETALKKPEKYMVFYLSAVP